MRRTWFGPPLIGIVGAVLASGCAHILEPERWAREVGIIEIGGEQPAPLRITGRIRVGESITATVTTYGSGTCTRPGGAQVEVRGLVVEVTPYDLEARGDFICTSDLVPHSRDVTLQFGAAGEAVVKVLGRRLSDHEPAEYELRLLIEP